MFGIPGQEYDKSTSIFSPEGRVLAAEYAKKAVEQGATSIGVACKDGVVLLAEKKVMPLQEPDSVEKLTEIDSHVGVATSGFMADARVLTWYARLIAQQYWLTYEEPIPGEALAEQVCDIKAYFTQVARGRPFGISMIIGSIDHNRTPRLFVTDPVGAYWGYLAAVIGRGAARAGEHLEANYDKAMTLDEATVLALDALRSATDTELTSLTVEIAHLPAETGKFRKFSKTEIDGILSQTGSK